MEGRVVERNERVQSGSLVVRVSLERFNGSFVLVEEAFTFARCARNEDGHFVTHYACSYAVETFSHDGNGAMFQGIDGPMPSIHSRFLFFFLFKINICLNNWKTYICFLFAFQSTFRKQLCYRYIVCYSMSY